MPDTDIFAHGTRWLRADFHLHTRKDREFKDDEESAFVRRYVAALKQVGIQVGVITNHNKFDLGEFKALRKAARKEDIYLLPGVELSVKDGSNGIHTLVVFHENWINNSENRDYIDAFLTATFVGQANFDVNNARSNHDLNKTIQILDEFKKDYMLIFAHVEEDTGLWGGLAGGRIEELGRNKFFSKRTAAFQKVRTRDLRDKVKRWLGGWYPAEVEGSDPKSVDEIGRGEATYIKIGAFTFEAVQFALKPDADRLSNAAEPIEEPHSWIKSIRFEGGILDGERLDFSKELNCLIGIRGSGKSAILESLRYALELPLDDTISDDWKYKENLVRHALASGGKVVVEAQDAQGHSYEIRRILNDRTDVYFEGKLRTGIRITETIIKCPLFFGQKELVSKGDGFERNIVESLLGTKLDPVRQEIAAQRQKVLDALSGLDRMKDLDTLEEEYKSKRKDAEFRLELFSEHGVEQQLQRQVAFNSDVAAAQRATTAASGFAGALDAFVTEQEAEFSALKKMESKENADLIAGLNEVFDRIKSAPARLRRILGDVQKDVTLLREKQGELVQQREALKDEFAAIERALSEQLRQQGTESIRPDDFVKLNAELRKAKTALGEITKSKDRKAVMRDELLEELKVLSNLWHREFKEVEATASELNASQSALRIVPEYKGDKVAFLHELQTHFRGSRLRESTLQGIVTQYSDFIAVYEDLDNICAGLGPSADVFRRYFNEAKGALLTWQVPNAFQVEYHDKELRDHSLGQRASALILFILSQRGNDVIIIDQPEDDLDNQTIFEDVIKLIRSLKPHIQFIFATHNANFPVLGDAEQVGACSYSADKEDVHVGSVDDPDVQEHIVSIMEGGHEAFRQRKEIYQLWKQ